MVKCLGGYYVFFIQNRFWKSVLFSERPTNISGFVNGLIILAQTCLPISIFVYEFDYIIKEKQSLTRISSLFYVAERQDIGFQYPP